MYVTIRHAQIGSLRYTSLLAALNMYVERCITYTEHSNAQKDMDGQRALIVFVSSCVKGTFQSRQRGGRNQGVRGTATSGMRYKATRLEEAYNRMPVLRFSPATLYIIETEWLHQCRMGYC